MNPKVSIIVPIFNAENTICRMVDSLLLQTIDRYEIILIDDGSTDSSGSICDRYAKKQSNVRVIHKCNEGVSASRQVGMDIACGEYVIHADSDDWVEPNMLEELYCKAKEENADVVISDFFSHKGNQQIYHQQTPSSCRPETVLHDLFHKLHGSCCNKLVKRACYSQYHINFPKGINHCEDFLFWVQLFQYPNVRIVYLPKAYYHYWVNEKSITRNYTRETYHMRQKFQDKLVELLPPTGFEQEISLSSFNIFTEAIIYNVLTKEEIRTGLRRFKTDIVNLESIRWKLGYLMLYLGLGKISRKLITY